jgi:hypothetical protein
MSNTIKLNDLTNILFPSNDTEFWVYDPSASFPKDRKLTFSNLYSRIKIAINNETPTLNLNITGNSNTVTSGMYLIGNQTVTGQKTFTALTTFNSVKINQDITIDGNLTVNGTQTILNTETLSVEDNIIEINRGLTGVPSSGLESGILVNRGDSPDYRFIFREIDNTFVIGETGDEQAVATREDTPEENGVVFWNNSEKRFDTSENFSFIENENISELSINGNLQVGGEDVVTTDSGTQTIAGVKTFSEEIVGSTNTQVSLTGNQTIAGTKTFTGDLAGAAVTNAVYPVGSYYVQYPNAHNADLGTQFPTAQRPADMFGGSWSLQFNTNSTGEGGLFFRTEGTGGYTNTDTSRSVGTQRDQMQRMSGGFGGNRLRDGGSGTGPFRVTISGGSSPNGANNLTLNWTYDTSRVARTSSSTGGETRPTNKFMRLWKRTS